MSRPIGLPIALMLAGVTVIFTIDTFAPLDIEIAVLYAVVVIASADFLGRRGIAGNRTHDERHGNHR